MSLKDTLTTLFGSLTLPTISAVATALSALAGYIYDSEKALLCLLVLMFFDFITGIIKAFKLRTLSSYTMQRFPVKIFVWFGMIAVLYHFGDVFFVYKYAASTLITVFFSVELTSLVENISIISPGLLPAPVTKYLLKLNDIDRIIADMVKSKVKPGSADAAGVVDAIAENADAVKKTVEEKEEVKEVEVDGISVE
ncbi:phage holin family protein [Hymenobacter canadensis]|uniref:Phage holin family protein n=1 Tax=Hymenobacter canadensis TaxID=2999067 RepID=A0ABY7LRW3_9BACT|nr:phage holin family protein [Hymenobacter canadensis]WBA43160.1 phage holin family protein [Hymenobacter canadensis]